MPEYGAVHKILVEHQDQGLEEEDEKGREVYLGEVRYILEHPTLEDGTRDCWGDGQALDPHGRVECPILHEIEAVGWADAIGVEVWAGLRRETRHFEAEGAYSVVAWGETYDTPEGRDHDGGLSVGEVEHPPRQERRPIRWETP